MGGTSHIMGCCPPPETEVIVNSRFHYGYEWEVAHGCDVDDACQLRAQMCDEEAGVPAELAVTVGTWRITYREGAWTENSGASPREWNNNWWRADYRGWNGALWIGTESTATAQIGPGIWPEDGYPTAAAAEAACQGEYIDIVIAEPTDKLCFFMHDNPMNDNLGHIHLGARKIA